MSFSDLLAAPVIVGLLRSLPAGLLRRLIARTLENVDRRWRRQRLPVELRLWNGWRRNPESPAVAQIHVRDARALFALRKPSLGKLATQYVEQRIDVAGDTREIIRLANLLCDAPSVAGASSNIGIFRMRRHSRKATRDAISQHYDASDEFFRLWLDERMVYSCAYFRHVSDTLEVAQRQKLDHICRKLDLRPGERFLDIGCGWGALILWAAERYGVYATGITISRNQFEHTAAQIRIRGLQGRCRVELIDYRDIPGTQCFDKISSVGMFEHVGIGHLPSYFAAIHRLLRPGGLVMNHGITLTAPERSNLGDDISDFIERYVFPGGELTHVSRVIDVMSRQNLECWDAECLRPHYAKTLWHWVRRLEDHKQEAIARVGDRAYRVWQIYMAGSAWAFEQGWLSVYQLLAGKPLSDGSFAHHPTREYVYANAQTAEDATLHKS